MKDLRQYRTVKRISQIAIVILCVFWSSIGTATDQGSVHDADVIAIWDATADRAQAALEGGRASTALLERLRGRLAEHRTAAFDFAEAGSVSVRSLEARLGALGPPPSGDAVESDEMAARRGDLQQAIADANAPILAANEAVERANVLIRELDATLRERQTADLLTRYPSALLAQKWPETLQEILQWSGTVATALSDDVRSAKEQAHLSDTLPASIFIILTSIFVLVWVKSRTIKRINALFYDAEATSKKYLAIILVSLIRLILPTLAAFGILAAWYILEIPLTSLDFFGVRSSSASDISFFSSIVGSMSAAVAIDLILAHALGHLLFAPQTPSFRLLSVDMVRAAHGYRATMILGFLSATEIVLKQLDLSGEVSPSAVSSLTAPILILGALVIWSLSNTLRAARQDPAPTNTRSTEQQVVEQASPVEGQFLKYLCIALKLVSLVIGIGLVFGYIRLSRELFDSSIETLALLAIALVLFHSALTGVRWLMGGSKRGEEDPLRLLPIILVLLLSAVMVPLFALVWGARPTDIAEVWRLMSEGVQLGDTRLSVDGVLQLIIVFALGFVATRWLQSALQSSVLPRTKMDEGARAALVTGVGYVGLTLAALIALSSTDIDLSSLAIVAGALSVGIGFGMQAIVSNFVSGIILLVERPIKPGDWIEVSGHTGHVRKISVRYTRIETFDRHDVIVPNADLVSGTVKNMTLTSATGRVIVPVSIAYGSNIEQAREILLDAAKQHPQVLAYPAPLVLFMNMGESGLDFELRGFIRQVNNLLSVRSDLMFEIYTSFRNAGIEIPFPQRDIHLRSMPAVGLDQVETPPTLVPTWDRKPPPHEP